MNLEAPEQNEAKPQLHKQDPRQRHKTLAGVRPTKALRWGGHPSAALQLSIIAAAWSRCRTIDRASGDRSAHGTDGGAKKAVADDRWASNSTGDTTSH